MIHWFVNRYFPEERVERVVVWGVEFVAMLGICVGSMLSIWNMDTKAEDGHFRTGFIFMLFLALFSGIAFLVCFAALVATLRGRL